MFELIKIAKAARCAAAELLTLPTTKKNAVLKDLARTLVEEKAAILRANAKDVAYAREKGLSAAMIDRLILDDKRIKAMAGSVLDVMRLADPVGEVVKSYKRNGLSIKRVRIPLGVICMIYESRPNVTIDAASLCFKSGNAAILRGGSEAFHSSLCLTKLMAKVLKQHGVDAHAVQLVPTTDRDSLIELLKLDKLIDVVIPRGGEGLMRFISEHARVPVIKHDKGVCSVFVDKSAKIQESIAIVVNGKTQRPGVCNALETLYVHKDIAKKFLPLVGKALEDKGVTIRGDAGVLKILKSAERATEADWGTEYLDLILSIKTVSDVEDAINQIRRYSSHHTESILTESKINAKRFVNALDSSCVMINTSTRFNDGGELGLGAEIGISTTKMHAYGPMGLNELTITKFQVESSYKIRA